jgi:hypothetical protein
MARVVIKCRISGEIVPTGLEMSAESWAERQLGFNRAICAACKQTHAWEKADAWLEMSSETLSVTSSTHVHDSNRRADA